MRANFIYSNLNSCGGGERFTLVTMKAVYEMGLEIDLTTLEQPNLSKLENAFGKDLASIMKKIRKINLLNMFDEQSIHHNLQQTNYDLIINTHADIDPYYHPSLNANNMIVYCHYPSAKLFIENEDMDYLTFHLKIDRLQSSSISKSSEVIPQIAYKNPNQLISQIIESPRNEIEMNSQNDNRKEYVKWVKKTYDSMIRNSFLITNSNYSKTAISQEYNRDDTIVLSPPVDVENIISKVKSNQRSDSLNYGDENCILVICRIEPSKRIENVIYLAQLLKERKIKTKINIVGSSEPFYQKYYNDLIKLISDSDVTDMVEFHIDASFEELVDLMKKSKIFFHPREGEHFGMSIVEAMSAGLIPVVPAIGGQTEFVPRQYQYKSLQEAAQIISSMLIDMQREQVTNESNKMIDIAKNFSETNYKRQFQLVVSQLLYNQI
ncbi:MAG TPA: glycosyltransferase [Candidatus Nitrosocosmicus sp.]|nr:glycosyltransferase [Candidatus Nitrosocosmicus sp.]